MSKFILVFTATMLLGFYAGVKHFFNDGQFVPKTAEEVRCYKLLNTIGCSPDFEAGVFNNQSIPILKGWGKHRMKVSTKNDSAFLYFNQGINMF
jgi:hypothetical protein